MIKNYDSKFFMTLNQENQPVHIKQIVNKYMDNNYLFGLYMKNKNECKSQDHVLFSNEDGIRLYVNLAF